MPTTEAEIERRSLEVGKWANLFMAVVGVVASLLSRSDALLVDGLYSGVNFISAIVAAKVGAAVTRPPDRKRPFGYDAEEPLYVVFRSLLLLGIIAFASLKATDKIIIHATGGSVPELLFGPILVYVVFMVVVCTGLALWHHVNWRRSGRRSAILRAESRAAVVDGAISAGSGGALAAVVLLRGTALETLVPVADAVVVLLMSLFVVREPIGMFRNALREAVGGAAERSAVDGVRRLTQDHLEERPFTLLDVAVTRMGRNFVVVAYLKPEEAVEAATLDSLRDELQRAYAQQLGLVKTAVILTETPPFY